LIWSKEKAMSPYQEAWNWMERHPGTGSATSMAKLVLSFWNSECSFSFRECISSFDGNLTQVAVRMAGHFARHGEDHELVEIGRKVCERYPRLWEAGQAMDRARRQLREQWEAADRAEDAAMYGDEQ
jgi:hypothetical protein